PDAANPGLVLVFREDPVLGDHEYLGWGRIEEGQTTLSARVREGWIQIELDASSLFSPRPMQRQDLVPPKARVQALWGDGLSDPVVQSELLDLLLRLEIGSRPMTMAEVMESLDGPSLRPEELTRGRVALSQLAALGLGVDPSKVWVSRVQTGPR